MVAPTALVFSITGISGDTIADYAMANDKGRWFAAHVTDFNSGISGWRDDGEGNECNEGDPGCFYVELTSAYFSGGDGLTPPTSIIPEPLSAALVGTALLGLVALRRKTA